MTDRTIEFQDFFNRFSGKSNDTDAAAFMRHWRTDFIAFSDRHDARTGETLLHVAVEKGFMNVAKDIVESWRRIGGKLNAVDGKGRSALHVAAESGNVDMCAMLLGYRGVLGFDIDLVDNTGRMPVQYALDELEGRERIKMVRLFVENGTDLAKASAQMRDVAEKRQAEMDEKSRPRRTSRSGGIRIYI